MPKRTNEFQKLVFLIKKLAAPGATVSESKMLIDKITGDEREVDVVIESEIAGHTVTLCFECVSKSRKADSQWVESMIEKHRSLTTNQLILISKNGFTKGAKKKADFHNVETFQFNDLTHTKVEALIGKAGSMWIKGCSLTAMKVIFEVLEAEKSRPKRVAVLPENAIYDDAGKVVCIAFEIVQDILSNKAVLNAVLRDALEEHKWFQLEHSVPTNTDGVSNYFLLNNITDQYERIHTIQISGESKFSVNEVILNVGEIGSDAVSWGCGQVFDDDYTIVKTLHGITFEKNEDRT